MHHFAVERVLSHLTSERTLSEVQEVVTINVVIKNCLVFIVLLVVVGEHDEERVETR